MFLALVLNWLSLSELKLNKIFSRSCFTV